MALTTNVTVRAPGAAEIVGIIAIPAEYPQRPEGSIWPGAHRRFSVIDVAECGSFRLT
jgi:hypothetical protein